MSTYEKIKLIIENKNGKLLSKSVQIVGRDVIKIECSNGHIWETTAQSINCGSWCRTCYIINNRKNTIEDAQKAAVLRDGKCLSVIYNNAHDKLKWQCAFGHIWEAKYYSVVNNGRWCPECNSNFSEKYCRIFLEKLFNRLFIKVKPKWLLNSRGHLMELDGYCEELGVAFEHNGIQHYKKNLFMTEEKLLIRKQDDIEKKRLCKLHCVKLITIPALFNILKLRNFKDFIKSQLLELNIKIPNNFEQIEVNLNEVHSYNENIKTKHLEKLNQIAVDRNGELLSNEYINNITKLKWKCNICQYTWEALPGSVKNGSWCSSCVKNNQKLTIKEMHDIAISRGGKCLSDKYINLNTKLLWQCKCGHIWSAMPSNIKNRGSWCPKCKRAK